LAQSRHSPAGKQHGLECRVLPRLLPAVGAGFPEQERPGSSKCRRERYLLPEADAARYFIDEEAKQAIQRALAASRAKAADGRERRSVEKLTAAVRYWELAAEFFEFRAQAKRVSQSGVRGLYASDIWVVSLPTD
jgi:hypothetical protein